MSRLATVVLTLGIALLLFAVPAAAVDSFFDVFTPIPDVGFPPLPQQKVGILRLYAGTVLHELTHNTSLCHGGPVGGSELPFRVVSTNGQSPGTPSTNAFFDIFYEIDLTGGQPWPDDSSFEICYVIDLPGGGPSHLVPLHPGVPDSYFDVFVGESFFDITYRVEVGPGGGCHELHVHFECATGLMPGNVQVVPSPNADSFFDVFFELHRESGQPIGDPDLPVIHTVTTGQYMTPPVVVQPATWGKVKSLYGQ